MLESLDNVSEHPGRSNLDLAGIPRKLTFNLANLSGHPGRKMYPGRDRIAWSGYNPPVSKQRWPPLFHLSFSLASVRTYRTGNSSALPRPSFCAPTAYQRL